MTGVGIRAGLVERVPASHQLRGADRGGAAAEIGEKSDIGIDLP
jgi:hypothetical protein